MQSFFVLGLRIILSLFLLAAVFPARPSLAQRIACVTEEMPPLQQILDGRIGGFSTEVVTAALERAGLEYDLGVYPWARAYAMARDIPNTLIFSIMRTPEREGLFKWAGELTRTTPTLYRLARRADVNPATLDEARRFKIVVIRDEAQCRFLLSQGFREGENLLVVNNSSEQFRALTTFPEIALIPLTDVTMASRARMAGLDPADLAKVFALPMPANSLHAAFGVSTPDEVVVRFGNALESLKQEGYVEKAKARWGIP